MTFDSNNEISIIVVKTTDHIIIIGAMLFDQLIGKSVETFLKQVDIMCTVLH